MSQENEKLYEERKARIQKAINHEPVDMIPSIFMGCAFAPRYMGRTQEEYCLDATAGVDMTIEAIKKLGDMDGVNFMQSGMLPMHLTNLWLSKVLIPGIDLDKDALWQVQEKEVMKPEDYDFIIENGFPAFVEKLLPKVCDMELMGKHNAWMMENITQIAPKFKEAGYYPIVSGITTIPFEPLCGARSMNQFFFDLYRNPDKVEEAMEVLVPVLIEQGVMASMATGVMGVWVGGWRTASAMLAPKLWDRFVWPYFRRVAEALIEKGITPVFHWDQDWTRDLERLKELPPKKCILNLDGMTDIRKAKEILEDHTAIMGDMPPTLFSAGTPDDIYEYTKNLVQDLGPKGLLLTPGCDAPMNTKFENMEAFVAANREYGKVS
ncbi:uroporphyrinogen decarboxylase family protein [Desulfatibacillum aliphaticivorans]|uniref:uroporphyrinogen decarboxylase family protein n=1 Tax=Desulfatibacillum aliphaticivorans TaxID=218208 RepID=UPI00042766ED|nr:uroporphyrinogen decarboxylase family protein [Desulfatibacillum aliphaticivorans]